MSWSKESKRIGCRIHNFTVYAGIPLYFSTPEMRLVWNFPWKCTHVPCAKWPFGVYTRIKAVAGGLFSVVFDSSTQVSPLVKVVNGKIFCGERTSVHARASKLD